MDQFASPNRKQNLLVNYEGDGFSLRPGTRASESWELDLRVGSIGRQKNKLIPAHIVEPESDQRICVDADRMSVQHDGFRIDYKNNHEGMRQDFIVEQRPAGNGPLTVELRAEGDLRPTVQGEDDVLFVHTGCETPAVWYKGLKAWDADGKELAAHVSPFFCCLQKKSRMPELHHLQ